MNISLYHLSEDLREAIDSAFDPETGEMLPVFEEKRELWANKASAVTAHILNIESDAEQCKQAIKRIEKMQSAIEKKADHLRNYLMQNMKACGISEVKGEGFSAKLYEGRDESLEIEEGAVFPASLCNDPKPPTPSKTKIKAAILAGEPVAGARIVRRDRLTIK